MDRETSQFIIPLKKPENNCGYDIYPSYPLVGGKIRIGYEMLVEEFLHSKAVILDGYVGVDWEEIVTNCDELLKAKGVDCKFVNSRDYLKSESELSEITAPFLGGEDPVFGKRTDLSLKDYFSPEKLKQGVEGSRDGAMRIFYGCGAHLLAQEGLLVYVDLPKNELQYRMRAGKVSNLEIACPKENKQVYKQFYFVDWVVLNKVKKELLPKVDIFLDQQRNGQPVYTEGHAVRETLQRMSKSYFRVRPWFEPGVWGGQWLKENVDGLNKNAPNYAWSFEMIVPENGLLLEDEGKLLEVSFDTLMYHSSENVLGKATKRFQDEFPIRFDLLDTYGGGNLSVQCHPKPDYIKKHFGENFTQDETYYILEAGEDAKVFLGFQNDIDPETFKEALEKCQNDGKLLEVEKYIQCFPSRKHDLFLIPNGTVHCSGINNLVLEISATPYIYTFKMYDWQRLDLDGNPRPLNIDRAMDNLDFERKGEVVKSTLISKPKVVSRGEGWRKVHLPTHKDHFYDIFRYEFDQEVLIHTMEQCHLLMLVEGTKIDLLVEGIGMRTFHYAETFAVPAATRTYQLLNKGEDTAKVVVAFVKDEAC